jgi:SAM-dependent methyltransferase
VGERSLAEEWEAQAQAWARWARTPGHDRHFHSYNWPRFAELIPDPGQATLDLGCGEGRLGVALHAAGHRLTGVDTAPLLTDLAAQTGAYEQVVVADAAGLPFPDGAFDLVIAFMSLQDMDDAAGAVLEAARVLIPGGRMVAGFVHPFASAHLGRDSAEPASYFDTHRTLDEVERNGIRLEFHQIHRSLQSWLEMFLAAGLAIQDVREPRPDERHALSDSGLAKSRRHPSFLHLRALRP